MLKIILTPLLALLACLAFAAGPAASAPSEHPLEVLPGSFHITTSTPQAGAHADLTTSFDFAHNELGRTADDARTLIVNLPPGFVGNNTAVPTCSTVQLVGGGLESTQCPVASQVGTVSFEVPNSINVGAPPAHFTVPLYNMEVTSFGVTVEFGFKTVIFTQILDVSVRPGDSGVTVTTPDLAKAEPSDISVTVWGLPAAHVHDAQRAQVCGESYEVPAQCNYGPHGGPSEAGIPVEPFLANATSCEPHVASFEVDSWEQPQPFLPLVQSELPATTECDRVPFQPAIEVKPTTSVAESPSGLDVSLVVPQSWENPNSLATANLKDARVVLPVGYTVNPGAGSGLVGCSEAQFESETSSSPPGAGCPPESKIGTVTVETPVLSEHLTGNIYIATPFANRFGKLLALYIVVKDPARGIIVKLAGQIEPDKETGQLTTTFHDNPQVPFSRFTLELFQGPTSPLVSPPACGAYAAEADLTPWSTPELPRHLISPAFRIEHGVGGGACPAGGVPSFTPGLSAGTLNNNAGAYSPLSIRITRDDGEQEITRFSSQLPPGLTADLTGIPFCPDADIEAAKHVSGAQEEAFPSCPAASEIGHSLVGAGVGSVLAYTPGKLYMAGPYNGAPFSIVAITSAKVGPFDLGTVVVREALEINPETAAVTVDAKASDPIPHIIDGIVIHVRDIRVYVDRPQFMINPTSCDPMSLAATIDGAGADPANPADQQSVTVTNSFQAADCQNLQFKPTFKVSTSGKPSRLDGESLSVKLTYPNAPQGTQTNIRLVKVELPKQLPSRLPTLQKACPEATFVANPALCPAASVIGHATATTPILPVPLTGPAYFVSYGGAKFPELIIVLQGYGVTLDLHGETYISKQGVTSSTFKTVPDDPIGSFELTLPQGQYSALAAIGNPCKGTLTMPTEFLAQNGDAIHQNTKIAVTGCPKAKKATHKRKHKAKAKTKAKKKARRGGHT